MQNRDERIWTSHISTAVDTTRLKKNESWKCNHYIRRGGNSATKRKRLSYIFCPVFLILCFFFDDLPVAYNHRKGVEFIPTKPVVLSLCETAAR
jgi:hypothetical protein